eukprot:comp20036_c1_seq2/m.24597 comp20036_c1_seq2/g.24597  ORF comp20036_c1_seq2/g.24597 comp20036_c1_seq2/m.24597 type:complete len:206 (-) comp20036_c1_seq2:166-783(-)
MDGDLNSNSGCLSSGSFMLPGNLEKKKSVRFRSEVEFHSYIQRGPSIDNLLDLLDQSGNVKTFENKNAPAPVTPTYRFNPVNFARPTQVPDTVQLGADLALVSLAFKGSFVTGHVLVKNLAFEKMICIRYTYDDWKTNKEVTATYFRNINGIDCFRFLLKVDFTEWGTRQYVKFCIRAQLGDRELWDNNGGRDYILSVDVPPAAS